MMHSKHNMYVHRAKLLTNEEPLWFLYVFNNVSVFTIFFGDLLSFL